MFRLSRLILSSAAIFLAFHPAFADLDLQPNGLPGGLIIRLQAADFATIVRQTKPDFVWNGTDMLWITLDPSGRPTFTMDHAYTVQLTDRPDKVCCLFNGDHYATGADDGPEYPFTNETDLQPAKIAHDPSWGTVYQARWRDVGDMGSGCDINTRNIFLRLDGRQHWHILEEGPITESGRGGANDNWLETVETKVHWTGDPAHRVSLSYTLCSNRTWNWNGDGLLNSVTLRSDMVRATADSPSSPTRAPGNDVSPLIKQGPYYIIASKTEPLSDFVLRLADFCSLYNQYDSRNNGAVCQMMTTLLKQANPSLSTNVMEGERITLPDKMYGCPNEWQYLHLPLLFDKGGEPRNPSAH